MFPSLETFSRKNNVVKVGKIKIKIPRDRSFFSMSANSIFHGEDFREDGYVYKDNKRLRKWFASKSGWKHFWHPVIQQLNRIERIYYKSYLRFKRHWSVIALITKAIYNTKSKQAHALTEDGTYACFTVTYERLFFNEQKQHMFTCDWLADKPKKVLNQKLGQRLYAIENAKLIFHHLLYSLLNEAIIVRLVALYPKASDGQVFELNINDRKYYYNYTSYNRFAKMSWPMDNFSTLTITE